MEAQTHVGEIRDEIIAKERVAQITAQAENEPRKRLYVFLPPQPP